MEEKKNEKKGLSYDELKSVAGQLSQQNQQLNKQLQEMNIILQQANMTNTFKHLDYLFKVLEHKNCFEADFVLNCVDEIVNLMTPPAKEEQQGEKGE